MPVLSFYQAARLGDKCLHPSVHFTSPKVSLFSWLLLLTALCQVSLPLSFPRILLSLPSSLTQEHRSHRCPSLCFVWVLGVHTQALTLPRQALYPLSHPHSSQTFFYFVFETGSHHVALAGQEFTIIDQGGRELTEICLPRAGIKGTLHCTWLKSLN